MVMTMNMNPSAHTNDDDNGDRWPRLLATHNDGDDDDDDGNDDDNDDD